MTTGAIEKVRIQFDLTPGALEEVDRLKAASGASTRAELFRDALKLYASFLRWKSEGYVIELRRTGGDNGERIQVEILA
jgi:metal-responsive CopG/Arc/MetJ family transcriptional regulator